MTWVRINDGLRMRTATGLAIARDGRHVYVGTDGEGVFRLDLDGSPPVALASQAPGPTEAPGTVVTSPGAPGTADPTASAPGPGSSAASGGAPGTTAGPDGVLVVGVVLVSLGALTALLALADGRSRGRSARATRIGAAAALGLLAVGGAIALVALVAPPAAPPVEGTPPPASGPVAVAAELMSEASTIQPGACTVLHWSVQGGFGVVARGHRWPLPASSRSAPPNRRRTSSRWTRATTSRNGRSWWRSCHRRRAKACRRHRRPRPGHSRLRRPPGRAPVRERPRAPCAP